MRTKHTYVLGLAIVLSVSTLALFQSASSDRGAVVFKAQTQETPAAPRSSEGAQEGRRAIIPEQPFTARLGDFFVFYVRSRSYAAWTPVDPNSGVEINESPLDATFIGKMRVQVVGTTEDYFVLHVTARDLGGAAPRDWTSGVQDPLFVRLAYDGRMLSYAFTGDDPAQADLLWMWLTRSHQFVLRDQREPWSLHIVDETGPCEVTFSWGEQGALNRVKDEILLEAYEEVTANVTVIKSDDQAAFESGWVSQCRVHEDLEVDVGGLLSEISLELEAKLLFRGNEPLPDDEIPEEFVPAGHRVSSEVEQKPPSRLTDLLSMFLRFDTHELTGEEGLKVWAEIARALQAYPEDLEQLLSGIRSGHLRPPAVSADVAGMLITALGLAAADGHEGCLDSLRDLLQHPPDEFVQNYSLFATHQLRELNSALGESIVHRVAEMTTTANREMRQNALFAAGTMLGRSQNQVLASALADWNRRASTPRERAAYLSALGNTRSPKLITDAAAPFFGSPEEAVREAVAEVLESCSELSSATRQLTRYATTDPSSSVRRLAAASLAAHRGPSVVATLCSIARQDRDPEVRQAALFALAEHGGQMAMQTIVDASTSDPSPDVRAAISQLLR